MASSNVTSVTSHFSQANEGFITTLGTTVAASGTVVDLASVTGLIDGSVFVGIIEPGGVKEQTFTGVVDTSGTQLTGVKWTRGTDVEHTAGVTIVDYVTGTNHNMTTKGILVSHEQDGTLNDTGLLQIFNVLYPVGSVYTNATVSTNPGTLLGFGTWTAFGSGRVLVGVDAGQTEFDTLGETGGAKTHTLSIAEMPAHDHSGKVYGTSNGDYLGLVGGGQGGWGVAGSTNNNIYHALIQSQGGGGAHNNLQPYIVVYMWKRTA